MLLRKKLKKLKELLKRHRDLLNKRKRIWRRKSERRDWLLSLLQKLRGKLNKQKLSLKLMLKNGRDWLRKQQLNPRRNRKLPLQLLLLKRLNLKPKSRESKLNMRLLLRHSRRLTDLLLWLLRLHTKLPKLLEKLVRKNKLLLIKDRWLLVDQLSKKLSEMCGPLEILVYPLST